MYLTQQLFCIYIRDLFVFLFFIILVAPKELDCQAVNQNTKVYSKIKLMCQPKTLLLEVLKS